MTVHFDAARWRAQQLALEDSLADARARSTNYNTPPTGSELDSRAREI